MCCPHLLSHCAGLAGSIQNPDEERAVDNVAPAPQDVSLSIRKLERKIELLDHAVGYLNEGMDWADVKVELMNKGYKREEVSPLLNETTQDLKTEKRDLQTEKRDLQRKQEQLQTEKNLQQAILLERVKASANVPPAVTGKPLRRWLSLQRLV